MSTRLLTRSHTWLCMLLLLAVAGALVPAHQAKAEEQKVVLSPAQVAQAAWSTISNIPTSKKRLTGLFVEDLILNQLILTTNGLPNNVNELQQRYQKQLGTCGADATCRNGLPPNKIVQSMLDAAFSMPAYKDVAKKVYTLVNLPDYVNEKSPVVAQVLRTVSLKGLVKNQGAAHQAALARAKNDPQFAKDYDSINAQRIGVSIKDFDPKAYCAAHPDRPLPGAICASIRSDGALEISLKELKDLATTEFGKINDSISDLQKSLVTIDAQQTELVDYMKNEQARHAAEAVAQAKAQEHQLKLQAADSAITIISALAGFIDPKLGGQIATVGRSALQIGESLNGWLDVVAGLNTLDKITSLSTVVMTGNVLSAVVNIVGLFGSDQPTPDQMILEEIGKLRQQVNQLRTEMHERFDRIDKELNTIYTTLQDRFDKIDVQLGKITISLDEIQKSLVTLGLNLSRIERNNVEFLDAVGRRPLREAINGALGYQQRTGLVMPYQPDFVGYENTFQTWGTVNAFDALSAGPTQRDYSDGQVLAELNALPLDSNLNYLNGWLSAHGMQPFASKRLASPRDWAFASQAYADLGFDWPQHQRRIDPQRRAALDAVGGDLEAAMQNISTRVTPNGPQGNAPLITQVISYYSAKLDVLDAGIQANERGFMQEVQVNRLQRNTAFDLFGGLDQPLAYQAADVSAMTCGGTADGLAAPSNLKNIIPDYNRVTLADYLGVSKLKVCLTGDWVSDACSNDLDPTDHNLLCLGFLQASLVLSVDNVELARRAILQRPAVIHQPDASPTAAVREGWDTFKGTFEAQFASAAPASAHDALRTPAAATQLTATTSALESKLTGYQQELYGRVLNGLTSGGLHPASVELAGAKKLLDSFITLGFPQAVDSDDFLRSLLFSNQQVVDDQQVIAAYAGQLAQLRFTSALSATQLTSNPRLTLRDAEQKRRVALSGLLTSYLESISSGAYSEDSALIADTRSAMQLAQRFANSDAPDPSPTPTPDPLPTPTPPGQRRGVFMPMVVR